MSAVIRQGRFRRTEIGDLPEEWELVSLGDLGSWTSGGTPSKSVSRFWGGEVPWVTPKDMKVSRVRTSKETITEDAVANGARLLSPGALLVVVRGMILAHTFPVAVTDVPVTINQDMKALVPNERTDVSFALFWLQFSERCMLTRVSEATHGTKRLTQSELLGSPVPLPPLAEQQKIAAILASVDDAIAATRKVIAQTRRVKQGLLQTLMTRGIGHTRFKKTEIGEIPEGWKVVLAPCVAQGGDRGIAGGPFGSDLTSKHYVDTPGVPVIRGNNLAYEQGTFQPEGFAYVSPDKADQLARNLAFPGDLVITQRGSLGQVGLIPEDSEYDRFVVSQSQMKLTPDRRKIRARFLWHYLSSELVLRWIRLHTIATGVPHINLGLLRRLPVPLPPLVEQDAVTMRLDGVQCAVDAALTELGRLTSLKQGLLQDLLTGRVRVPLD